MVLFVLGHPPSRRENSQNVQNNVQGCFHETGANVLLWNCEGITDVASHRPKIQKQILWAKKISSFKVKTALSILRFLVTRPLKTPHQWWWSKKRGRGEKEIKWDKEWINCASTTSAVSCCNKKEVNLLVVVVVEVTLFRYWPQPWAGQQYPTVCRTCPGCGFQRQMLLLLFASPSPFLPPGPRHKNLFNKT